MKGVESVAKLRNKVMNNSQLEVKSTVISTMASGLRDDAWHWRNSDVSQFSSEKLRNILNLSALAQSEEDHMALQKVRMELEKRVASLPTR